MTIPTGQINRLPSISAPAIAWCVNGAVAGTKHTRSRMRHVPAHRGVFPPLVRAQATATACSLPCAHGVSLARWSRAELVRQLAQQPALACVSEGTIGRWLRSERIRPWRYRMWQHIQDPTAFLSRARPVLQLYAQASSLLSSGTWL